MNERLSDNPPGVPVPAGALREYIEDRTAAGLASGALQSIQTESEIVRQAGVNFLVRRVSSLRRKDHQRFAAAAAKQSNPFLPYDPELYLGDLGPRHAAVLNKFNVVASHLLLVTRAFVHQEQLLDRDDFGVAWTCLNELDGLVFYNGGQVAGASQAHKHLQWVGLPLAEQGPDLPIEALFGQIHYDKGIGRSAGLPFVHAIAACEEVLSDLGADRAALVERSLELYHELLRQVGLAPSASRQLGPYNLLLTRRHMLLVPRSEEFVEGISLNALAYAGALLVRSDEQMERVRSLGPLGVLSRAGVVG
jgi:ATP adenylyltransferase